MNKKFIYFLTFLSVVILSVSYFRHLQRKKKEENESRKGLALLYNLIRISYDQVKEKINYKPFPESLDDCPSKPTIKKQYMLWDNEGFYPILYEDIRIYCKYNKMIILAMGDSITAGLAPDKSNTFPELLERTIENTSVINAGMNGANTIHWRPEGVLYKKNIYDNRKVIDVVLFLLGGNDRNYFSHLDKSEINEKYAKEIGLRLRKILMKMKEDLPSAKIILANYPQLKNENRFPAVEQIRTKLPEEDSFFWKGPDFTSAFVGKKEYFLPDKTHLSNLGHQKFAEIWKNFLLQKKIIPGN